MAKRLPQTMKNTPFEELMNWNGYLSRREKTMLPVNFLTKGSKNCFIPYGDKVIPRFGSTTYGQEYTTTEEAGIIGHYEKYKNLGGIEMEVRAYRSADNDLKDVVDVEYNGQYIPITENPNPYARGTGNKIYFTVFYDTNLDSSISKNLPRLVWVDGYQDPTTKKGRIFSWTGGIAQITGVTGSTVSLPAGTTWRELGFTENKDGDAFIVVNGTAYELDDTDDLDTNTIDIDDTTGITIGDIATSQIEVDEAPIPFDMCKQTKGYIYYGNIKQQRFFQSNAYSRPSTVLITGGQSSKNDLVIVENAEYTGEGQKVIRVSIAEVFPEIDIEEQKFVGTGTPIYFDTSGYNATNGAYNKYVLKCVFTQIFSCGTYVGTITPGEPIVGLTSGATGILNDNPATAANETSVHTVLGSFITGEVVRGQYSGATFIPFAIRGASSVLFYKNDVQIPLSVFFSGNGILDDNGVPRSTPLTLVDGLAFQPNIQNPGFLSLDYGDYVELIISKKAGDDDEFVWQINNGNESSQIPITGGTQTLTEGVKIKFIDETGHKVGDFWEITVNQKIERAWAEFYYSIDTQTQSSVRRPGEGYIYQLPSNFWTMDTLEESLYINHANGEWGYIVTELSADLLSEDIRFVSLKQAGANKVLYPYLTGHTSNDLIFINQDKELNSLGRMQLIERIQAENMSSDVKNDFDEASFVNGSIKFQDDKIWITSPNEFVMFCYDESTQYWQPPQYIPENAMLSVVGNQLISHSSITNTTRKINDKDAVGDDGAKYEVVIRSGTYDYGDRWAKKDANQTYFEAYIYELTPMELAVYLDVDEPIRTRKHTINPVFGTETPITATFGGGEMGEHEFGSSGEIQTPYCREIYNKLGVITFYFASLEFSCNAQKHNYEILSLGLNIIESKGNNKQWSPREEINNLLPITP